MNKLEFIERFGERLISEQEISLEELVKERISYTIIPLVEISFLAGEGSERLLVKVDEGILVFEGVFIQVTNEESVFACVEYDDEVDLKELIVNSLSEIKEQVQNGFNLIMNRITTELGEEPALLFSGDNNIHAKDYPVGKKFRTNKFVIWEVHEVDGEKVFFDTYEGHSGVKTLSKETLEDYDDLKIIKKEIDVNGVKYVAIMESKLNGRFGVNIESFETRDTQTLLGVLETNAFCVEYKTHNDLGFTLMFFKKDRNNVGTIVNFDMIGKVTPNSDEELFEMLEIFFIRMVNKYKE